MLRRKPKPEQSTPEPRPYPTDWQVVLKPLKTPVHQCRSDAFAWGMKAFIDSRDYARMLWYVAHWWENAFEGKPIPRGHVNANAIYQYIRYRLLLQDAVREGIAVSDEIRKRHTLCSRRLRGKPVDEQEFTSRLFEYENETEFGQLTFNFHNSTFKNNYQEQRMQKKAIETKAAIKQPKRKVS